MEQLSALDASFLYVETPTINMNVNAIAIFDPSTAPEPLTFERFRDLLASRIHLAPTFRRRIVRVPLDMDRPYWADDPDFDIDYHVRHIAVPPPGSQEKLWSMFGRIIGRPLDRERPLWELYFVEGLGDIPGLPPGCVAWITRIHHSMIDGVSGMDLLAALLDLAPDPGPVRPPEEPWAPEPIPGELEMLARATGARITGPFKGLDQIPRLLGSVANYGKFLGKRILTLEPPKALFRGPKTRLNGAITAARRFAAATLSLDDVKAVKKTLDGATVNDVLLTVCAGALRRYLDEKGELPEDSLVALTPISVRAADQHGAMGNQISSMLCPLATDKTDPIERLGVIHANMQEAKEAHGAIGAGLLMDATRFIPSSTLALAARLYSRTKVADVARPFFNVVISNVPGPQFPMYAGGAEMKAMLPSGPIVDGLGLFIGLISYCGKVHVGLTACREIVPDIEHLADLVTASMEELLAAAVGG
ncbi:MAG: wax ester/triacylglycerol synthase family O-acyltransferase [Myxococcales bacterium]|nr:wax ester/triacylglycerol synthase family O-acyltransferase [Myxococcales bacterium]